MEEMYAEYAGMVIGYAIGCFIVTLLLDKTLKSTNYVTMNIFSFLIMSFILTAKKIQTGIFDDSIINTFILVLIAQFIAGLFFKGMKDKQKNENNSNTPPNQS